MAELRHGLAIGVFQGLDLSQGRQWRYFLVLRPVENAQVRPGAILFGVTLFSMPAVRVKPYIYLQHKKQIVVSLPTTYSAHAS